ncbi:hypothetical protein HNR65_000216 [Desulfosalsimonas propionicica]|uniref:Methionine synthase II (Cobalamin-independent) n=1 Tax=Desulfosalsimonas propionicica TaxID=332175 RepID=A0A7W0C670_9BACT|nr:hypothetical protein [Desulfosalsimonas propionicica]MBA2879909.1 hypothetical protein [Desulfosalsimonas propionicica]
MKNDFRPAGFPAWIGSLPMDDHEKAAELMFEYTPDIPLWVQLPKFAAEGMVAQFSKGMPGLTRQNDKIFVDSADERFDDALLGFYEAYMEVTEGGGDIAESRFAIHEDDAPGFYVFMRELDRGRCSPAAVKGQVTGPFTFGTGLVDKEGRAAFYNEHIRDAAVKLIAMKARWQVNQLKKYGLPVILFLDEPALAGFGSSAFISVSRAEIDACFSEVIEAVHAEGGLAGVHVCANAEWPVILESDADIVSFDAYSYFDKFILYADAIRSFLNEGRILAWGIVPTGDTEAIASETPESLYSLWQDQAERIEALGFERDQVIAQSLITPSCGTGSLSLENAMRVIDMNRQVSEKIRGSR